MSKVIMVLYGGVAYFIGVVGLVSIIVVLAGLMPWGFLSLANMDMSSAIAWNIALVAVWGIIHSVMARPSFKQKLTQFIPEPAERAYLRFDCRYHQCCPRRLLAADRGNRLVYSKRRIGYDAMGHLCIRLGIPVASYIRD